MTDKQQTDNHAELRAEVRELLDAEGITGAELARNLQLNTGGLSAFLNGKYKGNQAVYADPLRRWVNTRKEAATQQYTVIQEPPFVQTEGSDRIQSVFRFAHITGQMCLIYGNAGVSKTCTAQYYAEHHSAVFLITMTGVHKTMTAALRQIAQVMGVSLIRDNAALFSELVKEINNRDQVLLIIDEAHNLGREAIDIIRQLHDATKMGVVFSGNRDIYHRMTGSSTAEYLSRLFSRLAMCIELGAVSTAAAEKVIAAWGFTDKDTQQTLVEIAQKPGGLRGMTHVIGLAKMIKSQDEPVTVADLKRAHNQLLGRGGRT
jgi:DNA transposition AAA+ family ATPase